MSQGFPNSGQNPPVEGALVRSPAPAAALVRVIPATRGHGPDAVQQPWTRQPADLPDPMQAPFTANARANARSKHSILP